MALGQQQVAQPLGRASQRQPFQARPCLAELSREDPGPLHCETGILGEPSPESSRIDGLDDGIVRSLGRTVIVSGMRRRLGEELPAASRVDHGLLAVRPEAVKDDSAVPQEEDMAGCFPLAEHEAASTQGARLGKFGQGFWQPVFAGRIRRVVKDRHMITIIFPTRPDRQNDARLPEGGMVRLAAFAATAVLALAACGIPPNAGHGEMEHAAHGAKDGAGTDARHSVRFPEPMRSHTLANMRDHLAALGEIQAALGRGDYDTAAVTAEQRLGMSSLDDHGAHDVAKFMPRGMQEAGTAMHRSASRFALTARDASVTGDLGSAVSALAEVNETCVACHAAYRLD